MADIVRSAIRIDRHAISRSRRRREEVWIAVTALAAALCALPLGPSSWHGPEVSAVLAVSATALLAGQRWAIAVVVMAETFVAPTLASRAFLGGLALWPGRIAALTALAMIVPGLLAMRRAAAALVLISGQRRTSATCRRFHAALLALGVVSAIVPLLMG
jgi:hypothetical protein